MSATRCLCYSRFEPAPCQRSGAKRRFNADRWVSGYSQQTVNLSLLARYEGSNPSLSTSPAGRSWHRAVVAQLVERVLGKDEVTSSILVNGSNPFNRARRLCPPWRPMIIMRRAEPALHSVRASSNEGLQNPARIAS